MLKRDWKKIYDELNLSEVNTWGGATEVKNIIMNEELEEDFNNLIDELFPNGLSITELNDLLSFDYEYIFNCLGIEYIEE